MGADGFVISPLLPQVAVAMRAAPVDEQVLARDASSRRGKQKDKIAAISSGGHQTAGSDLG